MRILAIEDEEKLAKALKRGLEREGFTVDYLLDGASGQRRIELYRNDYDLILLDLMLPQKDGFEVCREIRSQKITVPVLVLTAKDTTEDKVAMLESGADDYLVKPFSYQELVARVHELLRRPRQALPAELQVGDLVLNPSTRRVHRNGTEIDLTLKEYSLLEYFMRHPNQVLNREQILDHLWGFDFNSFSNVIDVHIKNLRKKIDENGSGNQILETIRGVGYRLRDISYAPQNSRNNATLA